MLRFGIGVLVGAAGVWLLLLAAPDLAPSAPPAAPVPLEAATRAEREVGAAPSLRGAPPANVTPAPIERRDAPEASAPPGAGATGPLAAIGLRVGEGLDLEAWRVVRRDEAGTADLRCEDLGSGWATFGTPNGSAAARTESPSPPFLARSAEEVAGGIADAPRTRTEIRLSLSVEQRAGGLGIGFVTAADGSAWKTWLIRVEDAPSVLDRVAWIRAERVPVADDGGVLPDPVLERDVALISPERYETLRAALAAIPGAGPTHGTILQGTWARVAEPPREARIVAFHRRLALPGRFDGTAEVGAWVGLLLEAGSGPTARLSQGHHGSALVRGDAEGEHLVRDHATLWIEGDLRGSVTVDFHAIAVVEGDLLGTLRLRDHARAFVRGRLRGTLELAGATNAELVLEGTWGREDVLRLPAPGAASRLHVRASDLGVGPHEGVGSWASVVVGGDLWSVVGR